MKFKNYKNNKLIQEAYNNLTENYAVITGDVESELKEYTYYKIQDMETYLTKASTELKESFIVINSSEDQETFKKNMVDLSTKYNQNSIRIIEGTSNYIISTNKNYNSYPGYGKIGVQQELDFAVFDESGTFNSLSTNEKSIEEGLNIVFPTEQFFR